MPVALSEFAKQVRVEVAGCPEPMILDAIRGACRDFCSKTEVWSRIDEITLVPETADVALVFADTEYPARIRNVLRDQEPIEKAGSAEVFAQLPERVQSGPPEYVFARTKKTLTFAPIPQQAETLEVDLVLQPSGTATEVEDVLYDEWSGAIAAKAKSVLMAMSNVAWSNPAFAEYYEGKYDEAVATAAVAVAKGNTAAPMRVAPGDI